MLLFFRVDESSQKNIIVDSVTIFVASLAIPAH